LFVKRAIVAMGGGPTRVINRSLFGVVDEAAKHGIEVLGALHGIQGVLKEDFRPLSPSQPPLSTHRNLPGAAIFSTRYKPTAEDCAKAFEIFKKREASYFFYIGGNDTAEATSIVSRAAQSSGHELRCVHVPKTIDNDLVENDHSPGYGSAARFVAHALLGDDLDVQSLPGIKIDIIMGRKAGWLAASAALCKRSDEDGPHLVYFPERPKSLAQIVADVLAVYRKYGRAVVAVSEGLHGPDGAEFIASKAIRAELSQAPYAPIMTMLNALGPIEEACGGAKKDSFGHVQLSGTGTMADVLAAAVKIGGFKAFGKAARCRADTFGYLQRCHASEPSPVDAKEAEMVGRKAVGYAVKKGVSGSVALRAERADGKYRARTKLIPLEAVAGKERRLPDEFINAEGTGVTPAFVQYATPLVGELLR
jgi:6-phosphofructokinase 1